MGYLILMRHGQSRWNKKNLFTGWVDVPLTEEGIDEAIEGGKAISHLPIDVAFTSTLIRAHLTLCLALEHHQDNKVPLFLHEGTDKQASWSKIYSPHALEETLPVYQAWELNERMYGELQGKNKDEMRKQYGEEQVHIWRRSFDVAPPGGESLKMTKERTIPYFNERILPLLQEGKTVFISAHGNSLRSIVMELESIPEDKITSLEIPTGKPLLYQYADKGVEKLSSIPN